MTDGPVIAAEGLTKRFGSTVAVQDVSFEVNAGQIVGFLGHNGAGKTTTLRMLLGHVRPDAGSATILGKPFEQLDHPLRSVGVQFESGLHPGRTARNHLRVCAAVGGLDMDRIGKVLRIVGLEDDADRRVGGFSQGMRQRLGLATALLANPKVLILDEPGNGLDPDGIVWLRGLLRDLADRGHTILLSSHQLGEVARTVDHVVVIDRGAVIAESSLAALKRRAGSGVVVRSPAAEVLALELERAGVTTTGVTAHELHARDVPPVVVSEIAARTGVPVSEVRAVEPSLEEVFLQLTHGHRNGDGRDEDGEGSDDDSDSAEELRAEDGGGADAEGDELTQADARLDRDLKRLPRMRPGTIVAVVAPADGLGRTTLSFLLGDVLAAGLGVRALAIALSCDRERMCLPVPVGERSQLNLTDLVGDLPGFDEAARLTPYVSVARSGLATLCGPRRSEELSALSATEIGDLLDFAARFYELIVLDVGMLAEGALATVLQRADHVVLVGAADAGVPPESPVLDAIETHRSEPSTLVFNRVDHDAALAFTERSATSSCRATATSFAPSTPASSTSTKSSCGRGSRSSASASASRRS